MSADLVKRWRRFAQQWKTAAEAQPPDEFAKRVDGFARADTFKACADSLERSLAIQARKAAPASSLPPRRKRAKRRPAAGNVSDAIDVFDISRLGDAGCDEIWVRIEDLKPLLSRAGLALVPAADVPTPERRELPPSMQVVLEAEILGLQRDLAAHEATKAELAESSAAHEAMHSQWRARVAELERNQVTPAMLYEFEEGKAQRDRLLAALDQARGLLVEMAQSWRDKAFGSQHCSELRSNILEECASELAAFAETLRANPATVATAARGERFLQRVEQAGPLEVTVLASCAPPATAAATEAEPRPYAYCERCKSLGAVCGICRQARQTPAAKEQGT